MPAGFVSKGLINNFAPMGLKSLVSCWNGRKKTKRGDEEDLHSQDPSSEWHEH